MRKFRAPLLGALLGTLLAAPALPSPAAPAPVALSYWSSTNPEEIALARKLVAEWNAARPGVQVRLQPIPQGNSSEEVLLAAVVAKTTPDLYSNILPAIMNRLVHAKAVAALDQFPDWKDFVKSRMDDRVLAAYRDKDGHFYQLPWKANPVMLAYNADLFAALRLTPPATYAEFMAAAARITSERDEAGQPKVWAMNPSPLAVWWQRLFDFFPFYVAASSGKTLLKDDKVDFDTPQAAAVFRFFREGFAKEYFPNTGGASDLFVEQKAAMSVAGPWAIKYYERAMSREFKIGFVPIPRPKRSPGPVFTYGDPKNIALFTTSKHPREAWEFAQFLVSRKADHELLAMTDQIPLRKGLADDPYFRDVFSKNPAVLQFARQAAFIAPMDDSPHLVQLLDFLAQQYEACAVYGLITPEKAVKDAAAYVAEIYARW